ncbi:hypothetical protein ACFSC3_19980 [Sphingomonas floccifaciens]|uniref:Uncharacterized protein n=1 Tax=Sphingomonas floccifaciens TaxID=1844115 RepID=A0ABW4NI46_9SPHN
MPKTAALPLPIETATPPRRHAMAPTAARVARARHDLARWMLSPAVAREGADGSVGVVNWLAADSDDHDGLYPEIGGYYLSFLTQIVGVDAAEDECRTLAAKVLDWFDRSGADGAPATIERRCARAGDWRNHCLFTFDLAMIVRGMIAVERRWPGLVAPALLARYRAAAEAIGADGRLGSHRVREGGGVVVPVKWSTQVDVHHVKAAAALDEGDDGAAVLARTTLDAWREEARRPVRELHPALYLVEGWLIAWARGGDVGDLARAADMFAAVLDTMDPVTLDLPAIVGEPMASSRGDAQAQLLRAGLILDRAGALAPPLAQHWRVLVPAITANVLDWIAPAGGMTFDRRSGHRNSWASMFAWGALELTRPRRTETAREDAARLI